MSRKRKKRVTWFSGLFIELVSLVGLFAIAIPEKFIALVNHWLAQVQSIGSEGEQAPSEKTSNSRNSADAYPIQGETLASPLAPNIKPSSTTHLARAPKTDLLPGVCPRYSTSNVHSSHRFYGRRLAQWP
ncbi:MAG: hypothetical protein VXZ82_22280 [Planctomycetota bacterium]|nr:hypothetical protein [Planctomycetota bacterium]